MRGAATSGGEAVLTIYSMMGGIELRIPDNWKLIDEVTPTLGAVEDKTTVASSSNQQRPRLVIRGSVTMGAVGIAN